MFGLQWVRGLLEMIGWAGVHTVWQAGLVLLAVRLLHRSLPATAARARYVVALLGLLGLVVLWLGATAWLAADWDVHTRCWSTAAAGAALNPDVCRSHGRDLAGVPVTRTDAVPVSERLGRVVRALAAPAATAVGAGPAAIARTITPGMSFFAVLWLVAATIGAFGLAGTLLSLGRIRRSATPLLDPAWTKALAEVRGSAGRDGRVEIRSTTRLEAPGTVGFFHPVILIPRDLGASLDSAQMRDLLAHEVAHARSWDYPVGTLQVVLERVSFFNPWLRSLSRIVRHEREALRDRDAVRIAGSVKSYVTMLWRLEKLRLRFAAGSPIQRSHGEGELFDRVRRIVAGPEGGRVPSRHCPAPVLWLAALAVSAGTIQLTCAAGTLASWAVMEHASVGVGPSAKIPVIPDIP